MKNPALAIFIETAKRTLEPTFPMQNNIKIEVSSKREKFVTLATARVNNALKAISLIGNLSNKGAYDFSTEDVSRIFKALNEQVETTRQRFEQPKNSGDRLFSLK